MRTTCETPFPDAFLSNDEFVGRYFIKEGRVSEEGTHDELRARKGDYYEYCMLQALGASGCTDPYSPLPTLSMTPILPIPSITVFALNVEHWPTVMLLVVE